MANNELVLGVDGGGTKTITWLTALEGGNDEALGKGLAGPGNPRAVGFTVAQANIEAAIDAAFAAANLPRTTVAAACLALAGVGHPKAQQEMAAWAMDRRLARTVSVRMDVEALLGADPSENWGIALVCGTGSLAWGRSRSGETARSGGWGYLLGDEGSGYAIAIAGLQAAVRSADGRDPPTALLGRFLERLDASVPPDMVHHIYDPGMSRERIASMADIVFAVAESDDAARSIVEAGAQALAECIASVARRLDLSRQPFPLALAGGTVIGQSSYRQRILSELAGRGLQPGRVINVEDPVRGAIAIARAMSGNGEGSDSSRVTQTIRGQ
jgi:N-acetylglucosamine kinase-like BadF-type ATPase